jgi:hypothetical protein
MYLEMAEVTEDPDKSHLKTQRKHKFREEDDLALLRQVSALGAHIAKRGSQGSAFEDFALALNSSGALAFC